MPVWASTLPTTFPVLLQQDYRYRPKAVWFAGALQAGYEPSHVQCCSLNSWKTHPERGVAQRVHWVACKAQCFVVNHSCSCSHSTVEPVFAERITGSMWPITSSFALTVESCLGFSGQHEKIRVTSISWFVCGACQLTQADKVRENIPPAVGSTRFSGTES